MKTECCICGRELEKKKMFLLESEADFSNGMETDIREIECFFCSEKCVKKGYIKAKKIDTTWEDAFLDAFPEVLK